MTRAGTATTAAQPITMYSHDPALPGPRPSMVILVMTPPMAATHTATSSGIPHAGGSARRHSGV